MRNFKISEVSGKYEVSYTDESGDRIVWGTYNNKSVAEIMVKYLGEADEAENV